MRGYTHAAAGALVGALVGHCTGAPVGEAAALGALAGLLPDIDHPGSALGSKLRPVSLLIELVAGHRTITHTIWFCLTMALLAGWLSRLAAVLASGLFGSSALFLQHWFWILVVFFGCASHLALDALTVSGIEPLAPFFSLHMCGPLKTGSIVSEAPIAILCVFALLTFF